jgi:hypothetical protein
MPQVIKLLKREKILFLMLMTAQNQELKQHMEYKKVIEPAVR